jgi:hypothetical protein
MLLREARHLVDLGKNPALLFPKRERADDEIPETAVHQIGDVLQREKDAGSYFPVDAAPILTVRAVGHDESPVTVLERDLFRIEKVLRIDHLLGQAIEPLGKLSTNPRIH